MEPRQPLPKTWSYATIVMAVIAAIALTGHSVSLVSDVIALAIVLAIAFAARALYAHTRR